LFTLSNTPTQGDPTGSDASANGGGPSSESPFVATCKSVIYQQSAQQGRYLAAVTPGQGTTFAEWDACATALDSFWMPGGLADAAKQTAIKNAMKSNNVSGDITDLVNAAEFAERRRLVGQTLGLPDCK
jgi:hypothetical protein